MIKITAKVDGMMCNMCEAHANDAVRKAFPTVKKVAASHTKNSVSAVLEEDVTDEAFIKAFDGTGYKVSDIRREPYEKKGFFSSLFK